MAEVDLLEKIPVADKIARELRRRMASGELRPHTYLPPQRALAREFKTSCRAVSEAVNVLSEDGLVVQTRGRGTRVLSPMSRLSKSVVGVVHRMAAGEVAAQVSYILRGVQEGLSRLGCRSEAVPVEVRPVGTRSNPGAVDWPPSVEELLDRFGALIFIQTFDCIEQILEIEQRRVPLVVANLEVDLDVTATCVDHRGIVRRSVELLATLGHRRIALLTRDPEAFFFGKTLAGYKDGLAAIGVSFDESLVAVTEAVDALPSYLAAKPLVDRHDRPTAVICARDRLARGACHAIQEAGLALGRDVSVISYDDLTWPTEDPFLTTFHEPCLEMGSLAAEMLMDRVVSGWRPPEKRVLETPLILRRSVGLAPHVGTSELDKGPEIALLFADPRA